MAPFRREEERKLIFFERFLQLGHRIGAGISDVGRQCGSYGILETPCVLLSAI